MSSPVASARGFSGRLIIWLGIGLVLIGPVLYATQIQAKRLTAPWYLPALATVGVALLLLAFVNRPNFWRITPLVLCSLLMGAEWFFLCSLSKLPVYSGPVSVGTAFPVFSTTLADGAAFDQDSLLGKQNTVMVFFRGRW